MGKYNESVFSTNPMKIEILQKDSLNINILSGSTIKNKIKCNYIYYLNKN